MKKYRNKTICGDCLEEMKKLPDNSVDSMVTDPPYGISFMGKKWDYDVPQVEVWKETLRVLKPGGHALVACGTRTQHRMAVNLEDAGFEIRDIVAWVYGSGFPKSHNIGKAVDKLQGNEREDLGISKNDRPDSQVKGGRAFDSAFNKGQKHETILETKGNSPYEGWGTALKPAMELWTLCRKPLEEKTIAKNVLKYGTGGINIDGCRVEYQSKEDMENNGFRKTNKQNEGKVQTENDQENQRWSTGLKQMVVQKEQGRFPANFIHDGSDEVVGLFPEQKGSIGRANRKPKDEKSGMFGLPPQVTATEFKDSGSAARFFYCAKASKKDRNEGLEVEKENNPRPIGEAFGSGNAITSQSEANGNNHPTVKPTALMQYLVRLVTPVGGTVLDPFMGSGSTGKACVLEGFDFIGIELDPEYCKIAQARIDAINYTTD